MEPNEATSLLKPPPSVFSTFLLSLRLLWQSEPSLFRIFVLNFLMSFQYYMLVTLIPVYFTEEFDLSDLVSGVIFGGFGVVIGLLSIIILNHSDKLSLEQALSISSFLGIIGFVLMSFSVLYLSLIAVLLFQAVSCAMSWPFIEYGVKMYSNPEVRTMACSLYFMCNYLAGILAGVFIDIVWYYLEDHGALYPVIYLTGAASGAISLFFIFLLRKIDKEVVAAGEGIGVLRTKTFWRFCGFILLLILMRSACFGHIDATFPKYIMRVLDDDQAHFGAMLAAHSVTIMLGIFFFTALTFYYKSYGLIMVGGLIGAVSAAILIVWEGYPAFVITIVGISVGEALWVPRLLDYALQIAPTGEEGVYLALSNCPFYFGMIITGVTSGVLLEEYCPEDGEQKCYVIWIVVFLTSIWIPIALYALRGVLEEPKLRGEHINPLSTHISS